MASHSDTVFHYFQFFSLFDENVLQKQLWDLGPGASYVFRSVSPLKKEVCEEFRVSEVAKEGAEAASCAWRAKTAEEVTRAPATFRMRSRKQTIAPVVPGILVSVLSELGFASRANAIGIALFPSKRKTLFGTT